MNKKILTVISVLLSVVLILSCGCNGKNKKAKVPGSKKDSVNSNSSNSDVDSSNDLSIVEDENSNTYTTNLDGLTDQNNTSSNDSSYGNYDNWSGSSCTSGELSTDPIAKSSEVNVVYDKTKKDFFYQKATQDVLNKYLGQAETLKNTIANSKSSVKITGKTYYVSSSGKDTNDGRSPETPIKTIKKVNSLTLQPGDGVLFKRGDKFRTTATVQLRNGVTYSAYGTGKKPLLMFSVDASSPEDWEKTEYNNIYRCKIKFPSEYNVGTIVFNGGEAWGIQVQKTPADGYRFSNGTVFNGYEFITDKKVKFTNVSVLQGDLEFYNAYDDIGYLYLYSKNGNPGDRFKSIEITDNGHGMQTNNGKDIVIDNLELFGTGSHGILIGYSSNCVVQYCKFSWIGGSIQSQDYVWRNCGTRWGNAVEAWNCDGHKVLYCHAEQVYDSCWTVQSKEGEIKNVEVANCLAELSFVSFEFWINSEAGGTFKNFYLHDNYSVFPGFGFSEQRPNFERPQGDGTYFAGSGIEYSKYINCSVSNNVNIISGGDGWATNSTGTNQYNFNNNVYISMQGSILGAKMLENPGNGTGENKIWYYTEESLREAYATGFENGSKFYYITEWPYTNMYDLYEHRTY